MVKGRKRGNQILGLKNDERTWVQHTSGILKHIENHYEDVFTSREKRQISHYWTRFNQGLVRHILCSWINPLRRRRS
ncbi:hypothetical protein Scep_014094 [Stephania cephalantha]|uniref:Uncharacterized protein n=1 Tax=Stephania cephalantha TaxID=152367 RepID=A0AAP0J0P1_9MAGN